MTRCSQKKKKLKLNRLKIKINGLGNRNPKKRVVGEKYLKKYRQNIYFLTDLRNLANPKQINTLTYTKINHNSEL